jgi:hypothetical protein
MTVQTSEQTTVAAPTCHGHGSAAGDAGETHAMHASGRRERGTGAGALGAVVALPRPVKIIGGAAIGFGALLAVGVPLATLTPLLFLGGCLSMHLFMGHGMNHGGGHGSHGTTGETASAGPAENTPPRKDG